MTMTVDPAFEQRKAEVRRALESTGDDRSPKGSVDERCLPAMEALRTHPDYVSTSSCSGRIALWEERAAGEGEEEAQRRKRAGGGWIWQSHDVPPEKLEEAEAAAAAAAEGWTAGEEGVLWVRFEPYILHVQARSMAAARRLTTAALAAGFRNSGCVVGGSADRPSFVVAVRSTSGFAAPVGGGGLDPVGGAHVRWLVRSGAQRLQKSWAQAAAFTSAIADIPAGEDEGRDRASERAARRDEKRTAGLRRQQQTKEAAACAAVDEEEWEAEGIDFD
eukprot:Hpha_TRINITY_DN26609_c0_g1::TRINITY_DN26609_c0_g1_i1::g.86092::m.86092/K15450/TYW3; tRNA wybutosine-synthesizing protein 3